MLITLWGPRKDHLDPRLKGTDPAVLAEYEEELRLYEAELQQERELACAELFVKAKAARAQEQAELVGYLKEPGAWTWAGEHAFDAVV